MLTFGPFVLIAIALLVAAYAVLDPTPPKHVVLATGPENTAYAKWGELYAAELRRFGIRVELRPAARSEGEGRRRLRAGRIERRQPGGERRQEGGNGGPRLARHDGLRPGVDLLPRRV